MYARRTSRAFLCLGERDFILGAFGVLAAPAERPRDEVLGLVGFFEIFFGLVPVEAFFEGCLGGCFESFFSGALVLLTLRLLDVPAFLVAFWVGFFGVTVLTVLRLLVEVPVEAFLVGFLAGLSADFLTGFLGVAALTVLRLPAGPVEAFLVGFLRGFLGVAALTALRLLAALVEAFLAGFLAGFLTGFFGATALTALRLLAEPVEVFLAGFLAGFLRGFFGATVLTALRLLAALAGFLTGFFGGTALTALRLLAEPVEVFLAGFLVGFLRGFFGATALTALRLLAALTGFFGGTALTALRLPAEPVEAFLAGFLGAAALTGLRLLATPVEAFLVGFLTGFLDATVLGSLRLAAFALTPDAPVAGRAGLRAFFPLLGGFVGRFFATRRYCVKVGIDNLKKYAKILLVIAFLPFAMTPLHFALSPFLCGGKEPS